MAVDVRQDISNVDRLHKGTFLTPNRLIINTEYNTRFDLFVF